ncbi:PREDICTED: UDP-glucuronosyltransferase 2B1-like [Priapulus caudatus]|uniref:UDP-glucuronosyltransferase 2B1-like n=1 Tax=Priapulus caudatus TaxID=37621 RepID=A0ABM1EFC1_PRICU|nr:PREDICTED: UDP-glucuronosyltransferase 2B1-like [Priapulus caudatus]
MLNQMDHMTNGKLRILLDTFRGIKTHFFVWSIDRDTKGISLPKNIKMFRYVPQNDILGHPQVVAFMTHGGLNSVWEALYHAVPMVVMPLHADQYKNAGNIVNRGIGVRADFRGGFSVEELTATLKSLLEDDRYESEIRRLSDIYHLDPVKPAETVRMWINYTINTRGAAHLHSACTELYFFQYWLLDVIAFATFVIFGSFAVVAYVAYILVYGRAGNVKTKSHKSKEGKKKRNQDENVTINGKKCDDPVEKEKLTSRKRKKEKNI